MKRHAVVLSVMFLISSYAFTAEMKFVNKPNKKAAAAEKKAHYRKDCVMMKHGKMMMMKDGHIMMMPEETIMPNGVKVMNDGSCELKNGKKMTAMKEGDCLDGNGNMMRHSETKCYVDTKKQL